MNAVSPAGKHERYTMALYALIFSLMFLTIQTRIVLGQNIPAESETNKTKTYYKDPLSREAEARIAATISAYREQKLNASAKSGSITSGDFTANLLSDPRIKVNAMYTSPYFDTQVGTAFSFPEDTHDFCRAYFQNEVARQDYALDAVVEAGSELAIQLNWTSADANEVADFDIYLFDEDGRPVGDPEGIFPEGVNGIGYQAPGDDLAEAAYVRHNGAASENLYIVVDRFRGPLENVLDLQVIGPDSSFQLIEYSEEDLFSYFDTGSGERLGTLSENQVIDLSLFTTAPPNLAIAFETDDCSESLQFTLRNTESGDTVVFSVDNGAPYTVFGDEGGQLSPGELFDGTYELSAAPFSADNAEGAAGPVSLLQFEITGNPPVASDTARVTGFSLVDLSQDEADRLVANLMEGDVVDLTRLPIGMNIEAFLSDPAGITEGVEFQLFTLPLDENPTPTVVMDPEELFLLFDPAMGDTLSVGNYLLRADPVGAPGADPGLLVGLEVAFSVLGPRISSFTFIDADTDQVIPGLDSLSGSITLDLANIPPNINIRANTIDYPVPVIQSVILEMVQSNGTLVVNRVESYTPYAVFGDCNLTLGCDRDLLPGEMADYFPWTSGPLADAYTLTGTPIIDGGIELDPTVFTIVFTGSAPGKAGGNPSLTELLPNFPNPFNPVTTIRFGIPERMPVRISVYDTLGREVKNLVDGTLPAGFHEVTFDAGALASGLYLYRLETSETVEVRLMTLLK